MKSTRDTDVQPREQDKHQTPRLNVLKTYKLYIGGKFPRTESGRYYKLEAGGEAIANVCLSSRKDLRNAVVAARAAQPAWASLSAFLRSQIIYRAAEMLEGRASQFASELVRMGAEPSEARAEVAASIDRLVYYAGWCDKYVQVFSSVNPVASSHFNFSIPGPTGVVGVIAPEASGLLGLISAIVPAIVGGNTVVALASHTRALGAVTFAEVLHTSDLPGGVVNLLTGDRGELLEHFASHMDLNAVVYCGDEPEQLRQLRVGGAASVKRVFDRGGDNGDADPYLILYTQEFKTTWHPIGQ